MQSRKPKLLQIGIIVRSLDKTIRNYETVLGIGPWEISELSGAAEPFTDLVVDGEKRSETICKIGICKAYGMELELIEPVAADTPYAKWLDEHGLGLQHIALISDEDYDEMLDSYQKQKGSAPWIRATGMGGLMDFSYLDYREELGLIMECYRNIEPGKRGIPYDYEGEAVDGPKDAE